MKLTEVKLDCKEHFGYKVSRFAKNNDFLYTDWSCSSGISFERHQCFAIIIYIYIYMSSCVIS